MTRMPSDRAKDALDQLYARYLASMDAWARFQDSYFEVAESVVGKGEYSPGQWLADAWNLSLQGFGLALDSVYPNLAPVIRPARGPYSEIELDQRNESGGPVRFPPLDGPANAPRLVNASATSGGVPATHAYARVLPNGEAWACLVNLSDITPDLPVGGESVKIGESSLDFARINVSEGRISTGSGEIPRELVNDPSLGLADLAQPTFGW